MNELDQNLLTGETIVYQTTKHWFSPIRQSLIAGLMVIGALVLRWLSPSGGEGIIGSVGGFVGSVLDLISIGLIVVGIAWIGYDIIEFVSAHFGVTNMRVLRYEGVLRRRSSETLLPMITDVRLVEPALGRMLGYGNLQILTSSGVAGEDQFTTIRDAAALRTAIQQQMANVRLGAAAAAMPSTAGPALESPVPSVPAAMAPMPAAPEVAPPAPAEDPTATLERLADMRAKGLISEDDYQAKKVEILGRI